MDSKARVSARLANLSAALPEINSMVARGGAEGGWAPVLCGGNTTKGVFIYLIVYRQKLTFSKDTGLFGTD